MQGLGKTVAQWQPRYAVHAGMYLYLLEAESSRTYMRYSSLFGKQLVAVPPSAIGGWEHVVALCDRGADLSKVRQTVASVEAVEWLRRAGEFDMNGPTREHVLLEHLEAFASH